MHCFSTGSMEAVVELVDISTDGAVVTELLFVRIVATDVQVFHSEL